MMLSLHVLFGLFILFFERRKKKTLEQKKKTIRYFLNINKG